MKKHGFLLMDNFVGLIIILIIITSLFVSVNSFKEIYNSNKHMSFKMDFLEFINTAKYRAINDASIYTLRFDKNRISLVNNKNLVVDRFEFPSNVEMIEINAINNRTLTIQQNGLISRGATFSYYFNNEPNKITILTVTGKVNYG